MSKKIFVFVIYLRNAVGGKLYLVGEMTQPKGKSNDICACNHFGRLTKHTPSDDFMHKLNELIIT